jgi:hypothetical protein
LLGVLLRKVFECLGLLNSYWNPIYYPGATNIKAYLFAKCARLAKFGK